MIRTTMKLVVVAALGGCVPGSGGSIAAAAEPAGTDAARPPRLIVLTDIGGDPDDQQSMIRLMVHSNEFDIEGLIASASGTPGELKQEVTRPQLIAEIVDAYARVRDNLARHGGGFPDPERLREVIRSGSPARGRDAIGAGKDTEASDWIVRCADRADDRPLSIVIWGGQTDFAQALWRVRQDRGGDGLRGFTAKVRVYDIGDQDRIADWLLEEFPGLFYILARPPAGHDRREAAYRGMYLGGDESLVSRAWMEGRIRQNHGPLGALYPTQTWTAPNPHSAIKEGDTPSWFHFLPVGLNDGAHPDWGGWGGRFARSRDRIFRCATDRVGDVADARSTVWRWRAAFQNEFAARMDWCVKSPGEANHPPRPVLNGMPGLGVVRLAARPGAVLKLSADGSTDPDGDSLRAHWWVYGEAGDYAGGLAMDGADRFEAALRIPADAAGHTIHVILELEDSGAPPLTRYRRAVIAVEAG
jgi:hypothetical protein